jgi:two-component system chemotaxis sensor kinase CheA
MGDDPAVIGLTEIRGNATQLIDVSHFLQAAQAMVRGEPPVSSRQLVVVDARLYERETLQPVLAASGFRNSGVGSLAEAMNLVEQGFKPDAVIIGATPGEADLNSLVERMRRKLGRPNMPVVVLEDNGGRAGFTEPKVSGALLVPRGNRTMLLAALAEAFAAQPSAKGANMEMAA